jgi:hypothetical protein
VAIRTLDQLEAALTSDLKWRVHELFLWERLARKASSLEQRALLRGGLAVLYAHWEGYVKTAGARYLELVSRQGLTIGQLRPEIAAIALRGHLYKMAADKTPERHTELVSMIRGENSLKAELPYGTVTIRTKANLNFATFASIMHSLGCDASSHAASSSYIDKRILGARNEIAHGVEEYVSLEDWTDARDVVQAILRDVRVQLSNAAAQRLYLRAP